MLLRRTKILATLGPATDKPGVLEELFLAGVDVVRMNFSHGAAQDHIDRANRVRAISKQTGRRVGILADLQGPKIRIERFKENKVYLEEGQDFSLDINLGKLDGDNTQVGISYKPLAREVKPGTRLLLDDGRVVLDVVNVIDETRVNCTVVVGGDLSNNKGINLLGGGLSAAALTDKDKEDIKTVAIINADYVAISFPRTADDMHEARALLAAEGCHAGLVAKIERAEAMEVIDEIILASDAIMVARGDLGVEIGDANLPAAQKMLINRARELNRAVITATQMMESMIENPIPTRAEVFDVANAIVDGTDAIMLSAETASGKHPVKTVQAMVRICLETEKQPSVIKSMHRMADSFERVDEAIAMSAMYMANHTKLNGIASLTESGSTPLCMSRINSNIPIYAFSNEERTLGRVTLYKGVFPIHFTHEKMNSEGVSKNIVEKLLLRGVVKTGDSLILTKGDSTGRIGGTNSMKVINVTE
ncbi:MAG: pyruvate kinase [Methylomonas lenta]|nr:pyruvate kinase [Methylomonas lenta]